ncbi:MAG: FKBP-type peptidyl-prolyl cis-trans isomerase [Puniceicoccales bacterium]|jgi:FKBP-type peptidyl-prolyl cis-trans isomerase|nr:FKBP-type peptidyl-prolyl cis-trans isomerase [Puniceicoccales bacterium]
MKKLENCLIWFTLLGGSFPSLVAGPAPDSKGAAAPADAKASGIPVFTKEQTFEYFEIYGQLVVSNANITSLGFKNEEEKSAFLKGVRNGVDGKAQPPDLESKWPNIEAFLFQREQEKLESTKKEGEAFLKKQASESGYRTENGLVFKIITPGDAVRVTETSEVKVSYTGKCNGVIFDSADGVKVSLQDTIEGFSRAVKLVGQGGQVHVFMSPDLGYGEESFGPIPGGSVLEFTITVHGITNTPETPPPASATAPAPVPAAVPASASTNAK